MADDLTTQAARRIAAHLDTLRHRYPGALAHLKMMAGKRGADGLPTWPEWCWLPMAGAAAVVTHHRGTPDEYARVAAVGQWRLTGRHIVTPSVEVAAHAVPRALDNAATLEEQLAGMDLRIPRDRLLEELAGACYYLVTPVQATPGRSLWVHGCYVHLEWDTHTGRPELRILADLGTGWGTLTAVPVYLDQPTLVWSATSVERVIAPRLAVLGGPDPRLLAAYVRTLAWAVWPLVGALLDERAHLVGPRTIDGGEVDAMVRGARIWELTYTRPPGWHLRPI